MMITVENYLVLTENSSVILIIWMLLPFKHHYIYTILSFAYPSVGVENEVRFLSVKYFRSFVCISVKMPLRNFLEMSL